jgi:hypothetical protein
MHRKLRFLQFLLRAELRIVRRLRRAMHRGGRLMQTCLFRPQKGCAALLS